MVETARDMKRMKTEEQYRFLAKGHARNSKERNGLCDVIIEVEGVPYHGSRFVLGSASPVFKRMFLTDMEESYSKTVPLGGVSRRGFQVVWDFIFDERYGTDDEEIALDVLKDAHNLQIDILCQEYSEKLKKMLRPENAFNFLSVAECLKIESLEEATFDFISRRFKEFISTPEFLSLTVERLLTFLGRDDLEITWEIEIYEAVRKWLSHDPSRTVHMPDLLNQVRLPLLPLRYLQKRILRDPVHFENSRCLALIMEAKDFHIPNLCDTVPLEKTRTRGAGYYRYPDTVWSVGRKSDENQFLSLNMRDWSAEILMPYPWRNESFFSRAFSAVDKKLFVTSDGVTKVYDLVKKEWEDGPPPPEEVQWSASTVGLHSIFVCGGRFGTDNSKSVTQFELESWRWIQAPFMKYEGHGALSAFLDSNLHVIGGYPNHKKHERLDTRMKLWCELSQWPGGQNNPGVAIHNGELHVAGGGGGGSMISDVYVYDGRRNEWSALPSMKAKRDRHGLISWEAKLYAVGGVNTPSVEVYDGTEWTEVARLDLEICEKPCMMQWTSG